MPRTAHSRRPPVVIRDLRSAMRDCRSWRCNGLFTALRNGRVSAGSMPNAACSAWEPYTDRNAHSDRLSRRSRQPSRVATIKREALSCIARNGFSAAAGLRFSRTQLASISSDATNGLDLENSSYCNRSGSEASFVRSIIAAERPNIIQRPGLATHHPFASDELWVCRVFPLGFKYRLVEAWR